MGRMRGECDTVFRRMDLIEGLRIFQKVKIQYFGKLLRGPFSACNPAARLKRVSELEPSEQLPRP